MPEDENAQARAVHQLATRLGFWSAVLTTLWTLAFLFSAFLLQSQILAVASALLLAPTFVVLIAAIHHRVADEQRLWRQIALAFAVAYATVVSLNYFLFLTVVQQNPQAYPCLTMDFRSDSAFWALEALGYTFMSLATLCVVPLFSGGKAQQAVRWLFTANAAVNLIAVGAVLITGNPLHVLVLVSLGVRSIAFPLATILLAIIFRRSVQPGHVPYQRV